jgi:serine phosphatase RsbU (regulator of sigma subunit)
LLFAVIVILGYAFFAQLSNHYVATEINRLTSKLSTANRAAANSILNPLASLASGAELKEEQLAPLLEILNSDFSHVWIQGESGEHRFSWEFDGRRVTRLRESISKPSWIKESTTGVFQDESKTFFASVTVQGEPTTPSWLLLRAPLDDAVLRHVSEQNQISVTALTAVSEGELPRGNKVRLRFGDRYYVQRESRAAVAAVGVHFTRRLTWYDFTTHFPFFVQGARNWQTGQSLEFPQTMYLMNSTWLRLAKRLFSEGFTGEENVIAVMLGAVSILFLVIECAALLSLLLMTRTITGAVHNLDEGAKHIMHGDFSHRIRVKSRDQLSSLGETFNTMTASIERLLKEQVEKQRLESELAIALEVQRQLFPRAAPRLNNLQIAGVCNPARIVSGDYYDYLLIAPTTVGLALGDVSGKGVSAALLMASLQAALRSHSNTAGRQLIAPGDGSRANSATVELASPRVADIVSLLNQQLIQNTPSEKYVTFFYGVYDERQRRLTYTNAGHLPPLIFRGPEVRRLETGGTVLGLIPEAEYEQGEVHLQPHDVLVAYTDGITEAENSFEEQFGESGLIQVVRRSSEKSPDEIVEDILTAVDDWVGSGEPQDDMTLIVAKAT